MLNTFKTGCRTVFPHCLKSSSDSSIINKISVLNQYKGKMHNVINLTITVGKQLLIISTVLHL